eukprot:6365596-Amphidinium_carterae.1
MTTCTRPNPLQEAETSNTIDLRRQVPSCRLTGDPESAKFNYMPLSFLFDICCRRCCRIWAGRHAWKLPWIKRDEGSFDVRAAKENESFAQEQTTGSGCSNLRSASNIAM